MSKSKKGQDLHDREVRLGVLANAVPAMVWVARTDGYVTYLNDRWYAYTGLTPEESLGEGWICVLHPDDLARVTAAWPEALQRMVPYEIEVRYRGADGKYCWFLARALPHDSDGVITWFGTSMDIHAWKQAEAGHTEVEGQLRLLVEASTVLLASPDMAKVLPSIIDMAQRVVAADAYVLWRKDNQAGTWRLSSSAGVSDKFVHEGRTRVQPPLEIPSKPMIFPDVIHNADPLLEGRREAFQQEGVRSLLAIPLQLHGRPDAILGFYWRTPHSITEAELSVTSALGNLAAAALGTAELYDRQSELRAEAERSEQKAAFLATAGEVFASSLDYKETLAGVTRLAVPDFADWCAMDVVESSSRVRRVAVAYRDSAKVEFAYEYDRRHLPGEDHPSRRALHTGKPVLIEDVSEELRVALAHDAGHLPLVQDLGLKSMIITPLVLHGETLGLITFAKTDSEHRYTAADLRLAEELGHRAASAVRHARLYRDVQNSEERYRSLISTISAIVWTRDPRGAFVEPQPSWEAYTGQRWEEYREFGWLNAMHPEDRERINQVWRHSVDEQKPYEAEGRLFHALTGEYRHFNVRAAAVRNPDGSLREWVGTVTDIHERKKAEAERIQLLEREREARHSAELLNQIGPALLIERDPQRLIQSVTDIATKLTEAQFGALFYSQKATEGEPFSLYALSGAAREAFRGFPMVRQTPLFRPTFRDKQVVRVDDVRRDPRYGKNAPFHGLPPWHLPVRSYLAAPVVSRSGDVLGALLFGHEQPGIFTEQHEAVVIGIAAQAAIALDNARLFTEAQTTLRSLERSNEELRRANVDLEQFAYSASHDLKEPIRMVALFSQMLQRKHRGTLDFGTDEFLRLIVENAKRMDLLVEDLLAYTQAVGITEEAVSAVPADQMLDEALSELEEDTKTSGASIERQQLPTLLVKGTHLRQLFQNLLENAIKYRSDAPPVIRITAERAGAMWKFNIADNGIGIEPQYAEQVFGIFRRLHRTGVYPGTGIGLAICQKIVNRYGGNIWVDSEGDEKGSTFCFTLPGESTS